MPKQSSSVSLDAALSLATDVLPYRISTITAYSKICSEIDADALYAGAGSQQSAGASSPATANDIALVQLSIGEATKCIIPVGADSIDIKPKARKRYSTTPVKKNFGNQITLLAQIDGNPINIKLFKDGSMQLAGLRHLRDATRLVPTLTSWLGGQASGVSGVLSVPEVIEACKVCMICSDFDIGIRFKPGKLLEVLRRAMPGLLTSHEACRHPAVKIKYMHNLADPVGERDGVCKCDKECGGKGDGLSRESQCRKVTILLFHSGKVVVTGGVTMQQVYDAYLFVTNQIVQTHASAFKI